MRKISPLYTKAEKDNYLELGLNHWFNILVTFRHQSIQNQRIVSKNVIDNYHSSKRKIFTDYFPHEKYINQDYVLNFNLQYTRKNIELLCEFAFLIFKSISIENNVEWDFLEKLNFSKTLKVKNS